MLSIATQAVDMIGLVVALGCISLAVWILALYPKTFDSPYIGALYILGILLLLVATEIPTESKYVLITRFLVFLSVGYWVCVIWYYMRTGDLRAKISEELS